MNIVKELAQKGFSENNIAGKIIRFSGNGVKVFPGVIIPRGHYLVEVTGSGYLRACFFDYDDGQQSIITTYTGQEASHRFVTSPHVRYDQEGIVEVLARSKWILTLTPIVDDPDVLTAFAAIKDKAIKFSGNGAKVFPWVLIPRNKYRIQMSGVEYAEFFDVDGEFQNIQGDDTSFYPYPDMKYDQPVTLCIDADDAWTMIMRPTVSQISPLARITSDLVDYSDVSSDQVVLTGEIIQFSGNGTQEIHGVTIPRGTYIVQGGRCIAFFMDDAGDEQLVIRAQKETVFHTFDSLKYELPGTLEVESEDAWTLVLKPIG